MRKYKSCRSEHLELINQQIIEGVPFETISANLGQKGEYISSMSLRRHASSHIEGYIPREKQPHPKSNYSDYTQEPLEPIDREKLLLSLGLSPEDKYGKRTLVLLEKITEEIAVSAYADLQQHNQGIKTFPKDKLSSLKDIIALQNALGSKSYDALTNSQLFELYDEINDRKKRGLKIQTSKY